MPQAPIFNTKQKTKAEVLVDDDLPSSVITYAAWKVWKFYKFKATTPSFYGVSKNTIRKLEEGLRMMTSHVINSLDIPGRVGGGVRVGVDWQAGNDVAFVTVFPKSKQYVFRLQRDELGNVGIDAPLMIFSDAPSMNQALKVCGIVVQTATDMEEDARKG